MRVFVSLMMLFYVVSCKTGEVVRRFKSSIEPNSDEIKKAIEKELA